MTTQGQQPPFFLVARNAAAADSFRYVLEHEGYAVSGFSTDFNDALGQICTRQPAVVVVGSELPEITGLDFVRTVQREHSSMRSILFAREAEPEYAKIALDEGVAGLLSPDSFVKDILECTAAVRDGQRYIYEPHRRNIIRRLGPRVLLSGREREMFDLVGSGLTSQQIADRLFLSKSTVDGHRASIASKLGLSGPNALTKFALQHYRG